MPTYDYVCDSCQHEFELFQSIVDPPRKKCPECGRMKLRRLIGAGAALIFKGSGFYCTDYKRPKAPDDSAAKAKCPEGGSDGSPSCASCPAGSGPSGDDS